MLINAKTLKGYGLNSLNGEIGKAEHFYFDDRHWTIRYLIADTGNWLTGRQVLISPYALETVNKDESYINIDLTKKQIEDGPSLSSHKPVSLQFETDYYSYYGWPMYWGGPNAWGAYPFIERDAAKQKQITKEMDKWDAHLRSTREVSGYTIQAKDGELGHVDDFIIDDATWAIRYIVVATHNWTPGKKVLISPHWIDHVSWDESKVYLSLTRDAIKESPEYTMESLVTRDYEKNLHTHYKSDGYWLKEELAMKHFS